MTISIGGFGSQPKTDLTEPNVDRITSSVPNKGAQAAEAAPADETTTLVAGAASLAALTKLAMNGDETRIGKIEQLRQDIAAGAYKLEPANIADALLAEWRA
jgi:flagellar biosynthesis anti-sigma factor FlgM